MSSDIRLSLLLFFIAWVVIEIAEHIQHYVHSAMHSLLNSLLSHELTDFVKYPSIVVIVSGMQL